MGVVNSQIKIKIAPNLKNNIYIPENERLRGLELSTKLTLNNLNIIWIIK